MARMTWLGAGDRLGDRRNPLLAFDEMRGGIDRTDVSYAFQTQRRKSTPTVEF